MKSFFSLLPLLSNCLFIAGSQCILETPKRLRCRKKQSDGSMALDLRRTHTSQWSSFLLLVLVLPPSTSSTIFSIASYKQMLLRWFTYWSHFFLNSQVLSIFLPLSFVTNIFFLTVGGIFFDPPFGLNVADWDKERWDATHMASVKKELDYLNLSEVPLIVFCSSQQCGYLFDYFTTCMFSFFFYSL
jgi:hypothetical protein